jgi:hypothetical protein
MVRYLFQMYCLFPQIPCHFSIVELIQIINIGFILFAVLASYPIFLDN